MLGLKLNHVSKRGHWSIFQSRQQWCEEGDKSSWYFFNLEKQNSNQKSINRLELSDTNITEDPGAIWNEMKMYYQKLRRKTPINDSKRYLGDVKDINKVTDEDYTSMNKEIIEAELLKIVKPFSKNKTPEQDGLPSEFCKMFWPALKFCLLESYTYSYQTGNLNITQKRGILWLIPQKSDPLQLKNWLPLFTIHNSQYLYCLPTYKLMIHNVSTKITFYWHIHIYTSMTSLYYGSKGSWKSYWIYGPLVWYTLSHLSQQGCRGCKGATVITQC